METRLSQIQQLVNRPSESLSVELKRWIDPDSPEGMSKIVRAVLALRNFGGGYLIVGFDNETLEPDIENAPQDVRSDFHIDKIQGLISRFSSEPFEVSVKFAERDGHDYPVIVVRPGVKTPVASKKDLQCGDHKIISANDVYIRSLKSNNTPSTTKASWKDWPSIAEVCFDNREADIGRFFRRHLIGLHPEAIKYIADAISAGVAPKVSAEDELKAYLDKGASRFQELLSERDVKLFDHGAWEVALWLSGEFPAHFTNHKFLNLLDSSNPDYTGQPVWRDSRGLSDKSARPYVSNGVWESFIVNVDSRWGDDCVDFVKLNPKGRFYLRRALQDDMSGRTRSLEPLRFLDFGLPIIRSAEAIAVGIAFAKAMGCDPDRTALGFAFRWTRLRGRELTCWANPGRYIPRGYKAYQDEVLVFLSVPLDAPLSSLSGYVEQVVRPLYEAFDGFVLANDIIEDLTRRLIERRL